MNYYPAISAARRSNLAHANPTATRLPLIVHLVLHLRGFEADRLSMDLKELRRACTVPLGPRTAYVRRKGERRWHLVREGLGFLPYRNKSFAAQRYPFQTGLHDLNEMGPSPLFVGDWHIDFRQALHSFLNDRAHKANIFSYGGHPGLASLPKDLLVSIPEMLIFAKTRDTAQEVLEAVNAALMLINGYAAWPIEDLEVQPDRHNRINVPASWYRPDWTDKRAGQNNVYLACIFVANTWRRESVRLGLARFYHSTRIFYSHPLDASPSLNVFADFEQTPFTLAAYALAITAAYSCIEELELEPPKLKRGETLWDGHSWNSQALLSVRERLRAAGLDPGERVVWTKRGSATAVAGRVARVGGSSAPWASGRVRDRLVSLDEAILICARIRNRVAAHNTKSETKKLTPVDLMNVHEVCRHLLLGLGDLPVDALRAYHFTSLEFRAREA